MTDTLQDTTRARTPLSRERVLRAAIALADEHGLGALTMRRLAQQLGVEAMSLYHHVPGKDRLLEGMLELVTAEMEVARPDGPWKAELRRSALSAHEVLGRHPMGRRRGLRGRPTDPGAVPVHGRPALDVARGRLLAGPDGSRLPRPRQPHHRVHALAGEHASRRGRSRARGTTGHARPAARRVPGPIEHIEVHLAPRDPGDEGSFAFGLDLLLDGFERLLEASADHDGRSKKGKRKRRG